MSPRPKAFVEGLRVYEPGRPLDEVARELGLSDASELTKLASNENALGPSPRAVAAMREAAPGMHLYPDGGAYYLRQRLARRLDLDPASIIFGNGSNELIEFLGHVFLGPGTRIVMSEQAFLIYRLVADAFAAETTAVPMREFRHDLDAMARAMDDETRLVVVANPNNPTGTVVDSDALVRFVDAAPDHVLVVVDEAYVELLPEAEQPPLVERVRAGRPLVLLRTFSKTYGLAGLRIGYGLAPPHIVGWLEKFRQPFNLNAMAQAAALAALDDEDHVRRTRDLVRNGLHQLQEGCAALGLSTVPSVANFLLVKTGEGRRVFNELQREGVIVRPMDAYGLPDYVRVTVGDADQNAACLAAISKVMETR